MKIAGLLCVLGLLMGGCTTINPGYVGIEVNKYGTNRGVQDYPLKTGFVSYNPISTSIIEYPTFVQTVQWTADVKEGAPADESITFTTKESVKINADISLSYQLDTTKVPDFYVKFRNDDLKVFTYGFLHNVTRDIMMEVGGHYSVEQIMGDNEAFLHEVRERVQSQVSSIGVSIQQFGFIGAPRPPQQIIDSINNAQQAKYNAIRTQNELASTQAEVAKSVAKATGEAQAAIAAAEGQAKANKLLGDSLTDKVIERARLDVQWQAIQKWNGQLPTSVVGASGGPAGLLLNVTPKQ